MSDAAPNTFAEEPESESGNLPENRPVGYSCFWFSCFSFTLHYISVLSFSYWLNNSWIEIEFLIRYIKMTTPVTSLVLRLHIWSSRNYINCQKSVHHGLHKARFKMVDLCYENHVSQFCQFPVGLSFVASVTFQKPSQQMREELSRDEEGR